MKKIAAISGFSLLVLVMVLVSFNYIGPHLGWHVDELGSGSMVPCLKTGSLVVTRPVDPGEIEVGDIITFNAVAGAHTVIHRVIEIRTQSQTSFITKGDANLVADSSPVKAENVLGTICLHIPGWGSVVDFLDTTPGFIFCLVVPGLIILLVFARSIWKGAAPKSA